jgi:hypothetical protein
MSSLSGSQSQGGAYSSLSPTAIKALTTANFAALTSDQLGGFLPTQASYFSAAQIKAITTAALPGLSTDTLKAMNASQVGAFTTGQIQNLTTAQFATLEADDFTNWWTHIRPSVQFKYIATQCH